MQTAHRGHKDGLAKLLLKHMRARTCGGEAKNCSFAPVCCAPAHAEPRPSASRSCNGRAAKLPLKHG
eukprot:3804280-Alexandrium_andersonii.AAC.1